MEIHKTIICLNCFDEFIDQSEFQKHIKISCPAINYKIKTTESNKKDINNNELTQAMAVPV